MQTNEPGTGNDFEAITTLKDLGRYLQGLREKRHVTQESLSTKTGAITGHKITRSRISEIENAKRDQVTERELRTYMRGLKCTPRDLEQVMKVFTRCVFTQGVFTQGTVTPVRESPAGPDTTSPTALDAYTAGLGRAEDDLAPLEEKSDDDPAAAGHEEKERDHWVQANTHITPRTASLPQPSRHHWQRHRIALVAATALVVVALVGSSLEFSLRGESGDRSTFPDSPTALLVPHSAPRIAEDASNVIKDVTFPDGAPVRVNQRFTKASEIRNRLADRGDAAGGDGTQRRVEIMPVTPCGAELAAQRRPGTASPCRSGTIARPGAADERGRGVTIDRDRMDAGSGAMHDGLLSELNMGVERTWRAPARTNAPSHARRADGAMSSAAQLRRILRVVVVQVTPR